MEPLLEAFYYELPVLLMISTLLTGISEICLFSGINAKSNPYMLWLYILINASGAIFFNFKSLRINSRVHFIDNVYRSWVNWIVYCIMQTIIAAYYCEYETKSEDGKPTVNCDRIPSWPWTWTLLYFFVFNLFDAAFFRLLFIGLQVIARTAVWIWTQIFY